MSNYPPPPPYGGQYFPGPNNPFPPPANSNYAMNYQHQHMQQQAYQQPYGQAVAPGQAVQYANAAAYAQNQFHHLQPAPPPNPYAYAQYSLTNTSQPYVHGQAPTGMVPHYPHSNIPPPPFPPQLHDQWAAGSVPANTDGQRVPAPGLWSYAHAPDATDEAINRALAAASATQPPPPLQPPNSSHRHTTPDASPAENTADASRAVPSPGTHATEEIRTQTLREPQPLAKLPGLTPPVTKAALANQADRSVQSSTQLRLTWEEKKDKARKALVEMLEGGVTLEQLSQEGLDPRLLDELRAGARLSSIKPKATQPANSTRSLESGEVSEDDLYETGPPNGTGPATKPPITTTPQKSAAQPVAVTSPKKGEERKDYIARLLAAKQAVAKPAVSSLDGTASSKVGSSRPVVTPSAATDRPAESTKKAETKDPIQTELVRKRLEALKASARPAPIQPPPTVSQAPLMESSGPGELQHRYIPIQDADMQNSGEPMYTPRSNSFYADGDQGFAGLPGLSPVLVKPPLPSGEYFQPTGTVADVLQKRSDQAQFEKSSLLDRGPVRVDYPPPPRPPSPAYAPQAQSRKRAMASDFIDSPPRSKRRLGPDGDMELVIDVSDDEEGGITMSTNRQNLTAAGASFQHAAGQRSATGVSTPKSLNDLEAEMRAMKEKIAERQRNKRKAQEPATSSGDLARASGSGLASPNAILADVKEKSSQLSGARAMLQEKLEAERRAHALISAQAAAERRQAADATNTPERERRLSRKAMLEASIPKLDASIEATVQRMESIRKQQLEVQEELERGQRERQAIIDELNSLLSSEVADTALKRAAATLQAEDSSKQTSDSDVARQGDQSSSNQSSADLPKPTRQTPETVSSRAESHENSMEEPMDISKSSGDEDEEDNDEEEEEEEEDEMDEEEDELEEEEEDPFGNYDRSRTDSLYEDRSQHPRLGQLQAETSLPVSGGTSRDEVHNDPQDEYDLSIEEQFSDDDDKEDDEPDAANDAHEAYPESSADSPEHDNESEEEESEQPHESRTAEEQDAPYATPSGQNEEPGKVSQASEAPKQPSPSPQGSEEGEITDDERSVPDVYEPPEATAGGETGELSGISQGGARATGSLPRETSEAEDEAAAAAVVGAESVPTHEGSGSRTGKGTGTGTGEHHGHFQPYESPLNRFHSYRIHPQQAANVAGSSTSLTSAQRVSDIPLCRWETTGGICNDSSCTYQHFRDLAQGGMR